MTIGQRLKELRAEKSMTQSDLAEKLNVGRSLIAKYETDKVIPSTYMVIELAAIFEVTTDYLLGVSEF